MEAKFKVGDWVRFSVLSIHSDSASYRPIRTNYDGAIKVATYNHHGDCWYYDVATDSGGMRKSVPEAALILGSPGGPSVADDTSRRIEAVSDETITLHFKNDELVGYVRRVGGDVIAADGEPGTVADGMARDLRWQISG
jgi:hypothetical protein